jgi:hypothetical protein
MQNLFNTGYFYLFVFVGLGVILNIWKVNFLAGRKLLVRVHWDAGIDHPKGD